MYTGSSLHFFLQKIIERNFSSFHNSSKSNDGDLLDAFREYDQTWWS